MRADAMTEIPEVLRQRLALYRRYLAEGVSEDLARVYLQEIEKAKVLLDDPGEKSRNEKPRTDAAA
jgi:hypothetical protein